MNKEEFFKSISSNSFITEKNINELKQKLNLAKQKNDEKTILRIKKVINSHSYFLENEQNKKGRNYLIKRYLTKYGYKRNDKRIVFCEEDLDIIKLLFNDYTDYSFVFIGFACFTNGVANIYEPIYKLLVFTREKTYKISYVHFMGIDYNININCNSFLKCNDRFWLKEII